MDPTSITTLGQALTLLAIAVIVALTNWLSTLGANRSLKSANRDIQEVKTTLTHNNGGSSVKDQLDRMERNQRQQAGQLRRLHSEQARQDAKIDKLDEIMTEHLIKGDDEK